MVTTLAFISGIVFLLAGYVWARNKWREHRAVKRRIEKIEG